MPPLGLYLQILYRSYTTRARVISARQSYTRTSTPAANLEASRIRQGTANYWHRLGSGSAYACIAVSRYEDSSLVNRALPVGRPRPNFPWSVS